MKINLREASTKRGLVMTITGGIVLYQTVFGSGTPDIDALLSKVEWWIGAGITLAGLLGVTLPDEPKTPALPPIELQGNSHSDIADYYADPDRLRPDLPPKSETPTTGFNG